MENRNFGKVSVIIPTWNREKTILRAIESVLMQTYKNLEVLVCDDGSTDNTKNIVLKMQDNRVCWIDGEHSGLPAAVRNRGIKMSEGEWIAFLDSDDEWEKDKLEVQLNSGYEFVCTLANIGNKRENYSNENVIKKFSDLVKDNFIVCSSVLVKKTIIKKIGMFSESKNLKAVEDYALWLRVITQVDLCFIKKNMVTYFNSNDSIRKFSENSNRDVYWSFVMWALMNFSIKNILYCIELFNILISRKLYLVLHK